MCQNRACPNEDREIADKPFHESTWSDSALSLGPNSDATDA